MAGVGHLFTAASPIAPQPERKPRRSLRYRIACRANGRRLLADRGPEYFAEIGRAGAKARVAVVQARPSRAMVRVFTSLPPDVCDMLQQQSLARGVSMSGLVREYVLQGLGVARQSDKPAKGKKKRG